jgi:hypothetical protein
LCFLARRLRGMSDRLRGRGLVPWVLSNPERRCLSVCAPGRERGLGALTGLARRTGYSGSMGEDRHAVKRTMVRSEGAGRPGERGPTARPD